MKAFSESDIQTARSFLTQLVDVIQEDISGSSTRRKYQVFVTGGVGPGVTSSLFQTVYDQDFTLQTSNPVLDMTVGLFYSGSSVTRIQTGQESSTGKLLFPSTSMMMREKVDIYKQFAKVLLGDADKAFYAPFSEKSVADAADSTKAYNITGYSGTEDLGCAGNKQRIDEALFVPFKRLFHRDGIKKETFALKMYTSASRAPGDVGFSEGSLFDHNGMNLFLTSISGSKIFTDANSGDDFQTTEAGGTVGNLVNSSNTAEKVGVLFYDRGIAVLDMRKVMSGTQHVSGVIDAMNSATITGYGTGKMYIGGVVGTPQVGGNRRAQFIPDFVTSASIDDIVDHMASTRFQSGTLTAATFQNRTNINSTLYFCRANADEFNYSANPSFLDADGNLVVIDASAQQQGTEKSFTFVTKVGLHDAEGNLLAVAKLSRPVEKNSEKDVTFRVRLDF